MKWGWIFKGLQVTGIITGKLPAILEDGKVTVDEMVDFTKSILEVFDVPVSFNVPDDLKALNIGVEIGD